MAETRDQAGAPALLGVYGASFSWSAGARPALDQVTLELEPGTVTALLGPNGSGKSTLLKLAAGLLEPDSGAAKFAGQDLREMTVAERASRIAYVGSDLRTDFPLSVAEVVGLATGALASAGGGRGAEAAMKRALCWELRDRNIQTLSGGERQLVLVARALAQGARAILLDETMSRMDLNHQAEIGKLLLEIARDERRAVALVAHDLKLATERADICVWIQKGQLTFKGPKAQALDPALLRRIYPGLGT